MSPSAAPASSPSPPSSAPAASPAASSGAPTSASENRTQARIDELRARLQSYPDDGGAYRDLGAALLQRVREIGDPSLYDQADEALAKARGLLPGDPNVLVAIGVLQLARHEFGDALETGQAALAIAPIAEARGVVVDALTELGRYDEAIEELQRMVDQRPNLASYTRVSYARELHGDLEGALEALDLAAMAGGGAPENLAFVQALQGNLLTYLGRRPAATAVYEEALRLVPDYAPALMGLGRLAVGRGDLDTAIARFGRAAAVLPLPEYVIALGEAQEVAGDMAGARQSYDLARFEAQLFEASGVVVDLELAIFEADHGDPRRAMELAQRAYDERQTIRTADALAWAALANRDLETASEMSEAALRLGSQDPLLLYHAGAIAHAAGDEKRARTLLDRALELDPGFSATGAARARALLDDLG
jgi:tetratricopeptide (TPR) repeat protein